MFHLLEAEELHLWLDKGCFYMSCLIVCFVVCSGKWLLLSCWVFSLCSPLLMLMMEGGLLLMPLSMVGVMHQGQWVWSMHHFNDFFVIKIPFLPWRCCSWSILEQPIGLICGFVQVGHVGMGTSTARATEQILLLWVLHCSTMV